MASIRRREGVRAQRSDVRHREDAPTNSVISALAERPSAFSGLHFRI